MSSVLSNPFLIVLLLAVGVLAIGLCEALIRRPLLAAWLVLGITVVTTALGAPGQVGGGVVVRAADAVFALVLVAAVARLLRVERLTTRDRLLIGLALLLAVSLLRGLPRYGLGAVLEFRTFLHVFGAALYFASVRPHPALLERVGRLWLGAGVALAGIVALRWTATFAGFDLGPFAAGHASAQYALRAVDGPTSFIIGQAFVIALPIAQERGRDRDWRRHLAIAFGILVVLLNRRTVWVAVLAGLVLLVLRSKEVRRRLAPLLVGAAVISSVALLALPDSVDSGEDVGSSATNTDTLVGRVEGWEALLTERPQGFEWVIGEPAGSGFSRLVGENKVSSNPHNFYIEVFLRTGIIGLVCMLALYVTALKALRR
ncbi:MAG: O-antigen ligase family protein, partial [Actinomycetota bacterium]|nr:O-antigen ligase family protein [Actinomycetota bacterium]